MGRSFIFDVQASVSAEKEIYVCVCVCVFSRARVCARACVLWGQQEGHPREGDSAWLLRAVPNAQAEDTEGLCRAAGGVALVTGQS